MSDHDLYSPSALERILACPGSVFLMRKHGLTGGADNAYTREGTVAHEYAAATLEGDWPETPRLCNRCNASVVTPPCHLCGSSEYRIDHAMVEHLGHYIRAVQEVRESGTLLVEGIEQRIRSTSIPDFGGTIDYFAIVRDEATGEVTLYIVDLKYGAGHPVQVEGNPQLIAYAALVIEAQLSTIQVSSVYIRVVQPRVEGGLRAMVSVSLEDIDQLLNGIVSAQQSPDKFCPGDHCKWCPVRARCNVLHSEMIALAGEEFADVGDTSVSLTLTEPEKVARALTLRGPIEAFFDAMHGRALEIIQGGGEIPGFKAVASIGRRAWISDEETVIKRLTGRKLKKKELIEPRLKSPAQIEKLGYGDKIGDLVTRSDLGYRVVPVTARGESITFQPASDQFDVVSE